MLKPLENVVDSGSQSRIAHKDILKEVDQINVVVDSVKLAVLE